VAAFTREYDVLVCGGGVAGVAAALEASRAGMRTALAEKTVILGGLATSGLVYGYLPLCDGLGTQVTYGIAEELLHLSYRYGPGGVPQGWKRADRSQGPRFWTLFSPAAFALALDEALLSAGVGIWLDTLVCHPLLDGDSVAGVEVETKGGRGELMAGCVIDATGDADVAYRSGVDCLPGGDFLAMWALLTSLDLSRKVAAEGDGAALLDMLILGSNVQGAEGARPGRVWSGLDAGGITEFVLEGRRLLREHFARLHAGDTQPRDAYPITLPSMAQFRTTRHIVGKANIGDDEHGKLREDSVGLVADWRKAGFVWEVPYGALVPEKRAGLLVAGRCIASSGDAWEVTRVIPPAALSGQVAGMAAALAISRGATPGTLGAGDVQAELDRRGIPYHLEQVYG
jgi:hypothetical protein